MSVKHERYFQYQYTGAAIITKRAFSNGRYEIRASLPVGKQIHLCLFTVNDDEKYWHENGEIDMLCSTNRKSVIERGVYFANSSEDSRYDDGNVQLYRDLHEFHTYGVEWEEGRGLRFFFDQVYSKSIVFTGM